MPEADTASKAEKEFYVNVPQESRAFFLKGSNAHDWGMNNRLARIFNPQSGKAVMLAFDHGYFQGPTTGLERIDLNIVPLAPYADALMLTRGILRSTIPATHRGGKGCGFSAAAAPAIETPAAATQASAISLVIVASSRAAGRPVFRANSPQVCAFWLIAGLSRIRVWTSLGFCQSVPEMPSSSRPRASKTIQ